MHHFLFSEMIPKGQPNIKLLMLIVKSCDNLPASLAKILLEMVLSEEHRPSVASLFKKLFKLIVKDIDLEELAIKISEFSLKDFQNVPGNESLWIIIVDILCLIQVCCFYEIGKDVNASQKEKLASQIKAAKIQSHIASWLRYLAPIIHVSSVPFYIQICRRLFFFDPIQTYVTIFQSFEVNDKQIYQVLNTEVPVLETTITNIIIIAHTASHIFPPKDTLDMLEKIIIRAALLQTKLQNSHVVPEIPIMQIPTLDLLEPIISLSIYKPRTTPDIEAEAQTFVVIQWYWEACLILVCDPHFYLFFSY